MSQNPKELLEVARSAFSRGLTRPKEFRLAQLHALLRLYEENSSAMLAALQADLRKPEAEAYIAEIDYLKNDARHLIYHLGEYITPEKPDKSLANMMDTVLIHKEPYGVALIIGAWNYPLQLTLAPLAGAIAAGNCAIIKPSEVAPSSANLIAELLPRYLNKDCYHVVLGGVTETTALLKLRWDYIFFTGSSTVGKIVNEAAAKFLTPVTLELGGKSPVFLDDTVDIETAAARIMWGKCINVGQTCIAPDYLICTKAVEEKFIAATRKVFAKWYDGKLKQSRDYGRIINENHAKRLIKLLDGVNVAFGGDYNLEEKFIHPTIVTDVKPTDLIMQEEIFGPLLPIVNFPDVKSAVDFINQGEKPLALYIFSNNAKIYDYIIRNTSSGGVCVNDTIMHFSCENVPFGGVGNSGIGAYHGKYSFDTFSHRRGTLIKDINKLGESLQSARYPPFTQSKLNFISMMTKKRPPLPTKYLWFLVVFGLGVLSTLAAQIACKEWKKQN